jgi:SnoaL-like domain
MSDSLMLAVLAALDALDLDTAISLFAPDAVLDTPYGEQAAGREQVRGELGMFFAELRATQHDVTSVWNPEPGVWIAEVSATYELTDFSRRGPYGRAFVLRAGEQGIEQLRIYGANESPLTESGAGYREVRGPSGWLPTL